MLVTKAGELRYPDLQCTLTPHDDALSALRTPCLVHAFRLSIAMYHICTEWSSRPNGDACAGDNYGDLRNGTPHQTRDQEASLVA